MTTLLFIGLSLLALSLLSCTLEGRIRRLDEEAYNRNRKP